MLKLLSNFKKWQIILIIFNAILIFIQVFFDLKIPEAMSIMTQHLISNAGQNQIWQDGLYMLGFTLISLVLTFVTSTIVSYLTSRLSYRLRQDIYRKIFDFKAENLKQFSVASLITRTTNDVSKITSLLAMGLLLLVRAPLMAIWAIIKIINKHPAWLTLVIVVLMSVIIVVTIIMILVMPSFKKVQKLTDNINRVTRENVTGVRVLRAFNAEEFHQHKFDQVNDDLTNTNLKAQRKFAFLNPYLGLMMSMMGLGVYLIGAFIISNQNNYAKRVILFSDMVVLNSYGMQVIMAFIMMVMVFMMYPPASVSAKRILEILNTKVMTSGAQNKIESTAEIEFKKVYFKYDDAEDMILKNINLKIKTGQTIAFVGSTGSGKTTLVNLIPRFYDATKGQILVGGIDVRDYQFETLNQKFGYVSQKAVLFAGTIKSNLQFGKKIPNQQLNQALKTAEAWNFVKQKTGGLNAKVAQKGNNFSGGQKQRLSIARAIARNPQIYIFDDSFSALDYKTESKLRQNLKTKASDATILIIAQRLSTIKTADQIVVMSDGKIVGVGKHQDLIKNNKVYQEIALSQLSKEEL